MSIKKVKGHQYLRHIFDHGPISNSWQIKFRQENKSHDVHSFAAIHQRFIVVLHGGFTAIIVNAIAIFTSSNREKIGDVTMTFSVQAYIHRIDFFYGSRYCEVAFGLMVVRF